jgi:Na+/proline symporter
MAVILYTSAIILVRVIGCDPRWHYPLAIMVGAVTTTYTLIGGIRTVMVTEVLQSGMLVLGAFLTIILITVQLGGVGPWSGRSAGSWSISPPCNGCSRPGMRRRRGAPTS